MWTLTPCSEIPSSAAMALLVLPCATLRRMTCCLGGRGRGSATNESIGTLGHYAPPVTSVVLKEALEDDTPSWHNFYVGAAGARVGFICRAPAHLDRNGALVDHLTIHETAWAYCP